MCEGTSAVTSPLARSAAAYHGRAAQLVFMSAAEPGDYDGAF